MTLGATEFLRRFFLHVLPKGFVRIRHFGFLANRFRASHPALGRQLLGSSPSSMEEVHSQQMHSESASLWHCPRCRASMVVIQRFTAAELTACIYFDSSYPIQRSRSLAVREHADALVYPVQANDLFHDLPPTLFHVPTARDTTLTGFSRACS
jgi:hypothetical protein